MKISALLAFKIPTLFQYFHTLDTVHIKKKYDRATVECAAKFKTQQQYTLELNSPYTAYT